MTVRNLSPATQASYITAVKRFSLHHGRSPADLGVEDVRAYQVHLVERKIAWASLNQIVSALRFLYGVTLGRTDLPERIPYARVPKTLPVVLSTAEVARLIEAVDDAVCRTALATVYATGLRTAEVLALCIEHIESPRELIRVEQGKGRKDRYVMLSPTLLATLRAYWKIDRPRRWLFPKSDGPGPISASTLNAACMRAALVAKIGKPVTVKTLRHNAESQIMPSWLCIAVTTRHSESVRLGIISTAPKASALGGLHEELAWMLTASLALKEKILTKTTPHPGRPGRYRPDDKLLGFLNSL